MNRLREMLDPQSVALIGATDKSDSTGLAVLNNLLQAVDRPLYPVNPNRDFVSGLRCYASILDVPSPVNLAVVVAPAHTVPAIVDECGRADVSGMIILSAGFSESGPDGKALEGEIADIRRKYGMRIIGPNCLGVIIPRIRLNATFLSIDAKPGKIALISHALGEEILDWGGSVGIGFSMFASLGSMIDIEFGDIIDLLNGDFNTRSIMIYMENVRNAKHFISAGRGFALSKPIVVLKPGRSEVGARLIAVRTGRATGDDRVYDAVFKRIGIIRVKEVRDLFNMAEVLDSSHLPRGSRLAVITNDGGVGIVAVDALEELGGGLAKLSDESVKALSSFLPGYWNRENPVDIMADADRERYRNTIEVCLRDQGVDGVVVIYTPRTAADAIEVADAIVRICGRTSKPVIAVSMGGRRAARGRDILLESNVPAYATPEEAVRTYLYMYRYRRNIELLYETPAEVTHGDSQFKNVLKKIVKKAAENKEATLDIAHSFELLKHYGIPVKGVAAAGALMLKLRSYRDPEFETVLVLGPLEGDDAGASVGLPPLNRTLARRMIEDTQLRPARTHKTDLQEVMAELEDVLVSFSNIVVDFAGISGMDIVLSVKAGDVFASGVTVWLSADSRGLSPRYPHLVIAPYPSHYIRTAQLRDGTEVLLRPIRPEDEIMGREMLSALSEETLRIRFFSVPRIDRDLLIRFCNIDYDRETAIIAQIESEGRRIMIGGVRLISDPDPHKAQFAILVRDDYQGMGLASKLMEAMIDIGREKQLGEIYGIVLSENEKMLAVCRKAGFKVRLEPHGISRVSFPLKNNQSD
ncbi:MAG TPA: hypothetical protein DDZ40_07205 [Deltaproteobacteria bacterium]|nr:hypothetical protein [Deltaproteobacteria bacterium]